MPEPVTYPALVQNYRANWESTMTDGLLPEIALSSGLGSADPSMVACSGRSLLLEEEGSTASVNVGGATVSATAEKVTAGFALFVPTDEPATPGRLVRFAFGDKQSRCEPHHIRRLHRVALHASQVQCLPLGNSAEGDIQTLFYLYIVSHFCLLTTMILHPATCNQIALSYQTANIGKILIIIKTIIRF
jgi:hypothetical protein